MYIRIYVVLKVWIKAKALIILYTAKMPSSKLQTRNLRVCLACTILLSKLTKARTTTIP